MKIYPAFLTLVGLTGLPASQSQELPPFKIVHLGDSYSAGNGARNEDGGRNYVGVRDCYRSPTNWGETFADSLRDVFRVTYINKACSGAQLPALLGPQQKDLELKTITGGCPAPDYPGDEYYQDDGNIGACRRYIFPQINAVDGSVNLVIMTFGGNDLGFASIVRDCFVIGLRDVESCRSLINAATAALDDLKTETTAALKEIAARLNGDAKVVLVSYPYLLLDTPYTLEDTIGSDSIDVTMELRALQDAGDQAQKDAIVDANNEVGRDFAVFYEGTKDLFDTHEPDPSVLSENDDGWIWEFDGLVGPEWYHFNAEGHAQLGEGLSAFFSFVDAMPGSFETGGIIDMAFVVDTTGSMSDEIAAVRSNLADLVTQLAAATSDYRVAVVSYKDFPEFCDGDYPSRVDQDFTNDLALIQAGIDSLIASNGCDIPETVYSGIKAALDLVWTSGATKIMIVIGDAPAKVVNGAEPISGLTASQLVAQSIALDPVAVTGANVGDLDGSGFMSEISGGTGGSIIAGSDVVATISEVIEDAAGSPFAWLGVAYSGKVGVPVDFDASGSFDSEGIGIAQYEWSFLGDGVYNLVTTIPMASYTYDVAFTGIVLLRVTSTTGKTALGSAIITVNNEGFSSQGDDVTCELDSDGDPVTIGEDGSTLPCTPNLPTEDKEGIEEAVGIPGSDPDCPFDGIFLDFIWCFFYNIWDKLTDLFGL